MSHPEGVIPQRLRARISGSGPGAHATGRSRPRGVVHRLIVGVGLCLATTPTFSEPPPSPLRLTLWAPFGVETSAGRIAGDLEDVRQEPPTALPAPAASRTDVRDFDGDLPADIDRTRSIPFGIEPGIEKDGSIPKADFPDDLSHPDRWRYIPEGLIPPGNALDRFLSTTFITPILSFEDDVGTGGGLNFADIDFAASRRQMVGSVSLSYTTEGQQQYQVSFRRFHNQRELPSGGIIQEERSWTGLSGGYQRTLTRRFYGIGPNSDLDDETSYSETLWSAWVGEQRTFPHAGDDWVIRWGFGFENRNLGGGRVTGVPDTEISFPGEFSDADGLDSLWITGGLRYDTRDSQHLPYHGGTLGLDIQWAPWTNGDAEGAIYTTSGSTVIPMPPLFHDGGEADEEHPPIDTLALGFAVSETTGSLPFWSLPSLGGNFTLRGYGPDRFVDRSAYHLAAEYRFWVLSRGFAVLPGSRIERFGLALFAEAGNVADEVGALLDEDPHANVGVGFRMTFERLALFRVDVGFSEEGSNLSVNFGLSF